MAKTVTATRKSKWLSVTVLTLAVSICSTIRVQAAAPQPGESGDVGIQVQEPPAPPGPSLISYVKLPPALEFCGEPVPLDILDVRERLEKEVILALQDQGQVILWLKRTTRYLPEVAAMLRESGLPPDLKYVPVVESALRPHAGSRKNAIGFWQFMEGTGKRHGETRLAAECYAFAFTPAIASPSSDQIRPVGGAGRISREASIPRDITGCPAARALAGERDS